MNGNSRSAPLASALRAAGVVSLTTLAACAPSLASTAREPSSAPASASAGERISYPETRRVDQVDDYHGTRVADPYRWLEDTDSPETAAWVEAQNRVTFGILKSIPEREGIERRLTELWNYERFGVPFKQGGRYFFSRNSGLQNQSVLYVQPSLDAEPRVLLDPNTLSEDGTIALTMTRVSEDGRYLAYGTSSGGSDWQEIRVREVETGQDRPDHLRWIKFSGAAWTHDGEGFFYSRFPEPQGNTLTTENLNNKLYYHRLGTPQSEDVLVYERPDQPEWRFFPQVTDDGRYLVIYTSYQTSKNDLLYVDLGDPQRPNLRAPVRELVTGFEANYSVAGNDGPVFYVQTDKDAPKGRVIAIDTRQPQLANWRTLIPEGENVLENVQIISDQFVASYLQDAASRIRIFSLQGQPVREIELPTLGSVGSISGEREDTEAFYSFTSFLYPTTIFRYDFRTGESSVFRAPQVAFDPTQYETKQVFYTSKDGTRVPMFITHRKGLQLDGSNPTLLYAYGGFNVSVTPAFSVSNLVWLERGGVYAVANLRGGGEYGEEWHQAGTKERKQNVFDDFIAAAEYLVREGYTRPQKLAIAGGSNGGLLVGAALNQRPDLFGAALPAVGVMDMLRYHQFTIGRAWSVDYGTSEDPEGFRYLFAYSPLHNIEPGTCYPATLVTTADHDDRVVPGHSFKYAAALQAAQSCENPVLIRIETRAGHGAGKPTSKQIEEAADRWAFLVRSLGMQPSR
ncbi:MAG TPA: prolyl oligopeptidase family serine peptidase [Longimicrobiaceae bacterium]|nr:prolyl oligopeptidase family serine peptidase [Longimicrobiaceae bacterium]